jgi:WhiB family redox-sensing transcriptional regulator
VTAPLPRPQDWSADALCAQTDPEAFFPEKGGSIKDAKQVCNGGTGREPCPVRDECLTAALDRDERHGVWGGKSERERRALRRRLGYPTRQQARERARRGAA